MVNREIRSSGTTWTGMTLHTFLLLPAKRSKSICPSRLRARRKRKDPSNVAGSVIYAAGQKGWAAAITRSIPPVPLA